MAWNFQSTCDGRSLMRHGLRGQSSPKGNAVAREGQSRTGMKRHRRVKGRGSKVEGRGSRVESRGYRDLGSRDLGSRGVGR
eukprot:1240129-Rhodomonas_salina.4